MRFAVCLTTVVLVASGCARPTPEMQVIENAAAAIGGKDRVQAVNTLILEGAGRNFNLGQNRAPEADLPEFDVTAYKRVVDFAASRWRQEQTRVPKFPTGNTAPQRQIAAVDGEVAFNVGADGSATRAAEPIAKDRRAELWHHPIGILRAALQGAQVTNARTHEQHDIVEVATPDGGSFTLSIDSGTKLPSKVVSMTYNTNLGDVAIETEFGEYQDVDGLKLPTRIISRLDKYTTSDIRLTKHTVNGDAGDLAAPAAVKSAAAPTITANVTIEQVGPGIWYLAGQSHHSVLVEFADHLTLIEAPQNETRSLAVIAKARELNPSKPLTQVVNTHHHFDHSGGLRAAVAEGLTVITQERNRPFYEDVVNRKHSIVVDALSKSPKPLKIETVGAQLTLKDASRTVELFHIEGNPHADTLLMAYFPKEKLLVEADVYNPPAPNAPPTLFPFAANLMENVQRRKLQIDRVVPIHGRIVPFSEVAAAAQTGGPKATD